MSKRTLVLVVAGLLLMFTAGWYAGRWALERDWSNPAVTVTAEDAKRASIEGADPLPAAGTKMLRPLPLRRMRQAIKTFTEKDPVVAKIGAVGRNDDKANVHLWLENRGDCKATRVAGVAYGYHARGNATPINKGGEAYVAFDVKDVKLDPKANGDISADIKNGGSASLAVAHIDLVECEGGKVWKRQ